MQVDPRLVKAILANKLAKFRSLNLPAGKLVKMHEDLLVMAIDSLFIQEEQIHDLNERVRALEKENTLLSLFGREVKQFDQEGAVDARTVVGKT